MRESIPWWTPQIVGSEYNLIKEVLDKNYLNEGEVTDQFEREVAKLLGVKHAVAATSGTAALFLSLAGKGIGPNDEVIVPDVTFIATANAVRLAGAMPVLVDVCQDTLNIDPERIKAAITSKTKAIIPVHVSGRAADMPVILDIAQRHGLVVIEDAAEAFMSCSHGKYLGTFGHAGCFSFSPNKTITTGQGGMIVTDDEQLHRRLRELKDQGRPVRGTGGDDIHHSVGYNFKLTNLQAAVGLAQLTALMSRIERQKKIHFLYREHLDNLSGIKLPGFNLENGEVPQWTDAIVVNRDELDCYLTTRKVHCRKFWFPLHAQAPFRLPDDRFPNSTSLMPHAIWLPSSFTLSDDDVFQACDLIMNFLSGK